MADALSTVAQVLETNPFYLRSKQIRQVDKALLAVENLTPHSLIKEGKLWKESFEGKQVLENRLVSIDNTQQKIDLVEKQIYALQQETRCWYGLEDEIRTSIIQHAKSAEKFLQNQGEIAEADVIQRYNRTLELKEFLQYADKSSYLCDAIYHFTQKERYNLNLEKLNQRINAVYTRIKTIANGFYVALTLSVFVATIPICVPFSITLWNRKQKLKSHLIVYEDLQRKEHKRLALADEGETTIKEIQAIAGELSPEKINELLVEIKELKEEFYDSERFLSVCAMILSFIDTNQNTLVQIFGEIPQSPHDRFAWILKQTNHFQQNYHELEELQSKKHDLALEKKQAARGYDRTILTEGITQLTESMKSLFYLPIADEHKTIFVEMCIQLPEMIKKVRETLYFANQNLEVNLDDWNTAKSFLKQYSHNLALYVIDKEIESHLNNMNESVDNMTSTLNTTDINKEIIV